MKAVIYMIMMVLGLVGSAKAASYDAFLDFDSSSNTASGTWQYGEENVLGGSFNLFDVRTEISAGVVMWDNMQWYSAEVIGNTTGADTTAPWDSSIILPATSFLHFHPGAEGQFGVVRWVCPESDYYQVDATFTSLRTGGSPTTTDVHVLVNSTSIYNSYVNGYYMDSGGQEFSIYLFLMEGDTVDFAVGYGQNEDWSWDSTGLRAVITGGPTDTTTTTTEPPTTTTEPPTTTTVPVTTTTELPTTTTAPPTTTTQPPTTTTSEPPTTTTSTTTTTLPPSKCPSVPKDTCREPIEPFKALLLLKEQSDNTKDKLIWKWIKGEKTDFGDFGDPLTTDDYTLCIYEAVGDQPSVLLSATAPAGGQCAGRGCWKATGIKGFKFKDKELTPDGLDMVLLKAGDQGKVKIIVKGKGANLGLPSPLDVELPVTVQLQSSNGECWGAEYFSVGVKKNEPDFFKAKAGSPSGAFLGVESGVFD